MGNAFARYDLDLNELLTFRLEKTVTIQVWQVGFVYRLIQLIVVAYVSTSLYFNESWAYVETPMGSVNAWPEDGGFLDHANLGDYAPLSYCANSSFSYAYDASFVMDNPSCETANPYEITTKLPGQLIFTTAFIEVSEIGWACADAPTDTTERTACAIRGGVVTTRGGQQCVCLAKRTVYPVGVDRMSLAFEHAVQASTSGSSFEPLAASSNEPSDPANGVIGGIQSRIVFANGTVVAVDSTDGAAIRMPLAGWLRAAATESTSVVRNVSLDGYNYDLSADYRDPTRFPPFRSSGVALQITIEYDNLNAHDSKPGYDNTQIYAFIRPKVMTAQWAGNGPITHYNSYPSGPAGAQSYDKVFRYRQGVVVSFQTTGRLYKMDWIYFLNSIVAGLVLMGVAKTVATMFAMYLAPNAVMIKNRTREFFKVEDRYAEIGLKALQRILQFDAFDVNKDGQIEVEDIVVTLAKLRDCTFEQAFAVAHLIIEVADDDRGSSAKSATFDEDGVGKVDFAEYMIASEGGKMIPFHKFLKLAPKLARIRGEVDRGACKAAFENQRAMTFPQLAKGLGAVEVVGEASDGTKNSALPIDFGTSTNIDVTIKEEEGTRMRQRAQAVRELDDAAPTKEGPIRSNDTSPWSFLQATPIVGVLFAPSTTPVDHGLPAPSTTGGRPGQAKGEATKGWF